jgi:hypothetical protein
MRDFQFSCSCGQAAKAPKLADHDWATLAGYGDMGVVRWYATKALAREGSDFEALEACPAVGGEYWLGLTHPFASVLGESFWCVHQPPLFVINGIDEDTDLQNITFIRSHLTEMENTQPEIIGDGGFRRANRAGVGRAVVEAVTTLDEVLALPLSPNKPDELLWGNLRFAGNTTIVRQGRLIHALCQTNVDWSCWAILHDTEEATDLLVFANFSDHDDDLRLGRTRLRQGNTMIGPGVPPEWLEVGATPVHVRRDNAI